MCSNKIPSFVASRFLFFLMEVFGGQRGGSFLFAYGDWLVFKHMWGVGSQVLQQVAAIRPLEAIRLPRSQAGQRPKAVSFPGPTELSWLLLRVPLTLEISSRASVHGSSLLEGLRVLLAGLLSLNGWKTALQAILRDMTSFQHFLIQVGSFLKLHVPLNCLGSGRGWKEHGVQSYNSSLEFWLFPWPTQFSLLLEEEAPCWPVLVEVL